MSRPSTSNNENRKLVKPLHTKRICMPTECKANDKKFRQVYFASNCQAPQTRSINVLMSTNQISTLVEDSNAEKDKIKEVEEPDHTFCLRRSDADDTTQLFFTVTVAYQLYSYLQ